MPTIWKATSYMTAPELVELTPNLRAAMKQGWGKGEYFDNERDAWSGLLMTQKRMMLQATDEYRDAASRLEHATNAYAAAMENLQKWLAGRSCSVQDSPTAQSAGG